MNTPQPKQIGGSHYEALAYSPSQFCFENHIEFNVGNIIKYLARWRHKNGVEDLKKAAQYCDLIMLWRGDDPYTCRFFALGGIYNKCRKEFLPQFTGAEQTILRKLLPSNLYKNSHRLSEVKKSILSYIERIELDKKRES